MGSSQLIEYKITNDDLVNLRIYVSFGFDKLKAMPFRIHPM